jgi:hypothetical protein
MAPIVRTVDDDGGVFRYTQGISHALDYVNFISMDHIWFNSFYTQFNSLGTKAERTIPFSGAPLTNPATSFRARFSSSDCLIMAPCVSQKNCNLRELHHQSP